MRCNNRDIELYMKGKKDGKEELQQENEHLKEELYEAQRRNNELEQDGQDIAKELSIRIDKAIEFIELDMYGTALEILKGEE